MTTKQTALSKATEALQVEAHKASFEQAVKMQEERYQMEKEKEKKP